LETIGEFCFFLSLFFSVIFLFFLKAQWLMKMENWFLDLMVIMVINGEFLKVASLK